MMKITFVLILFTSCNLFVAELLNPAIAAFDVAPPEETSSESASTKQDAPSEKNETTGKKPLTPEQREDRKQMLPVIWLLLIGVAILGGILILLVILFGSRVRRIARKPLPAAPLRDPLWYLKPKAGNLPEADGEPPETDQE